MSFLTDAEKLECQSLEDQIWDTFKEQVVIYKTPDISYVNTNTDFNFIFGEQQPAADANYVTKTGIFHATVEYIDNRDGNKLMNNPEKSPIQQGQNYVHLSFSGSEALEFIKGCEKIVFDGANFKVASDHFRRSIFGERKYTDVWLQKI